LEDKKWGVEICWHPKNNWFHTWVLKLKVAYGLGRFSLKKTLVASRTHKCVQMLMPWKSFNAKLLSLWPFSTQCRPFACT
jgi:hypothetical protein